MLTVIPTIDVEGVHGSDPFNQMIIGNIGDKESWGIYRQAKIFQKYGISATFFVDIYEHSMWGEKYFHELCSKLIDMGQDVQLHTHPGWRVDVRDSDWLQNFRKNNSFMGADKDLMTKLSLDEQTNVLEHGMEMLYKWTGVYPIAHRSGGYSVNKDTLRALKSVGIPIDSSMYYGHPNSHETWSRNAIIKKDGIIELPVTLANYVRSFNILNKKIKLFERSMKTDIDFFDYSEFRKYYFSAKKQNIKLLNLFMHSYSLIKTNNDFNKFSPNRTIEYKLEQTLEWLSSKQDVQIISCKDFLKLFQDNEEFYYGPDNVPEISLKYSKLIKYGTKKIVRKFIYGSENLPRG